MNKIIFTPEGKCLLVDWPEKPIKGYYDNLDPYDQYAYSNALEKYSE